MRIKMTKKRPSGAANVLPDAEANVLPDNVATWEAAGWVAEAQPEPEKPKKTTRKNKETEQ